MKRVKKIFEKSDNEKKFNRKNMTKIEAKYDEKIENRK